MHEGRNPMIEYSRWIAALTGMFLLSAQPCLSQSAPAATPLVKPGAGINNSEIRERWKAQLNENATTIVSGNPNGAYLRIAYDIAAVVDNGDDLRVLPVIGKGAVQNTRDILFLKGIDMGLVNAVSLDYFKRNGELGSNLESQIAYITLLFQDELHVLVRPEINSLRELDGKRVNFSDAGSGAQLSARGIFSALGMTAKEVNVGQADAIEMMKRGELEGTICTCLKPLAPLQKLGKELGFKLVPVAYETPFQELYVPTKITAEDYPNLIPQGQVVETIAVQTLLATYNWPENHPRYPRIEKFVNGFFSKFQDFMQPPRDPRWKTVNISAQIPGWKRFSAAEKWLAANKVKSEAGPDLSDAKIRAAFETFLAQYSSTTGSTTLPDERVDALYADFSKWWKNKLNATPR